MSLGEVGTAPENGGLSGGNGNMGLSSPVTAAAPGDETVAHVQEVLSSEVRRDDRYGGDLGC